MEMSIRTIFDCMVKPIKLYGCETCGFGSNEITERLHLKLCKLLPHLKTSTPDYMVMYDKPLLFKLSWIFFLSIMKNHLL
jgi:hypothetical protein